MCGQMNKSGQVIIYAFMVALVVIILALSLAPSVKVFTDDARNETTGMNCTSPDLSNYDKAACVTTDMTIFYFIGGLIFIAGIIITAKIVFT